MTELSFEKRPLVTMNRCYAVSHIVVGGQTRVLLATEGEGPCLAWPGPAYDTPHTVWDGPGGTMSMVPVPGTDGEFLAVQLFLRMFQWDRAKLVHVRPRADGGYDVTDLLRLPYLHRFDLLPAGGRLHLLACTLSSAKDTKEDWSRPGQVYVGEYTGPGPLALRLLRDGLTRNHGYSRFERDGRTGGLVTCDEGAFEVMPPDGAGADWQVRRIMDWPIGDIAALDIDGDGEPEFATIEPFHGQRFRVWKREGSGWRMLFEHPEVSDFYHVVAGTRLRGEPVFIGGCRRGRQQLFVVRRGADGALHAQTLDEGVGPSNVHVVHEADRDLIVAANREKAEGALYVVT